MTYFHGDEAKKNLFFLKKGPIHEILAEIAQPFGKLKISQILCATMDETQFLIL